ncbi:coat protein [Lake Sarah-associated circular virus-5]|uniref:coat protein n=1 Tax=Lake Sarah-associated circular virus-5 TaxID=1685779 RepID=UPI000777D4AB|nr:coat protein [Lake Sarah-associated circular virus-5]ALE29595.1 coat protein [Lake Sarah-associated circular virus-5]
MMSMSMYSGSGGGKSSYSINYSSKRGRSPTPYSSFKSARVQPVNQTTASAINMEHLNRTEIYLGRTVATASGSKAYGGSKANKGKGSKISYDAYMNTLFPPYSQTVIGYGNNYYNKTKNATNSASAGDDKSIYIAQGRQAWREYVAMPFQRTAGTNGWGDLFTTSVTDLLVKAQDVLTTAVAQSVYTTTTLVPSSTTTVAERQKLQNLSFHYSGGYQRHKFVNTGNSKITIEFFEAKPRNPMPAYGSSATYTVNSIGASIVQDMQTNVPRDNSFYPSYDTTDFDNINDQLVRLNAQCATTNYKWLCNKPVKHVVDPGGEFIYTMGIDAFEFKESEFNTLPGLTSTDISGVQWFYPKFTKFLVCRFTTEIGHSTDGVSGFDQTYTGVGYVEGMMAHTCTEHHNCRFMPIIYTHSNVTNNRLDKDTAAIKVVFNDATGAPTNVMDDV